MRWVHDIRWPLRAAVIAGFAALAAGCADSTIHTQSAIGGVDTLALDAKQRMVFVAHRQAGRGERVTCTEPMPDALVARAAVLSASGNATLANGNSGGGSASGGSSESAASIGFRNESIQMLRDGYYRLCEAYMNGALTRFQYQHMIMNADTFMAVVSALQTLGNNPTAQQVALTGGSLTITPGTPGTPGAAGTGATTANFQTAPQPGQTQGAKDKSPEIAGQIVRDYLKYRMWLARELMLAEARQKKSGQDD